MRLIRDVILSALRKRRIQDFRCAQEDIVRAEDQAIEVCYERHFQRRRVDFGYQYGAAH